ncbi:MAG: polysaccharide deacetylase family protein [Armatimonadota bacterium]|nr:polysaccharide deacetylase family protein [Armatimonadota bacterium]MDR5704386.1 polysaccharide deacetylase family protein [Armatimonadota bacterium]
MKHRPAVLMVILLVLIFHVQLPLQAKMPQPYPHLAGTLPSVEEALLKALQQRGLEERVWRIAADSNGHLVVTSLVFASPVASPQAPSLIERYAWNLVRTAFEAVPSLGEVDLTAYPNGSVPFLRGGGGATFTAAVSREEFLRLERTDPVGVLRTLPRVWFDPLLAHPAPLRSISRRPSSPSWSYQENRPTFRGLVQEQVEELWLRIMGRVRGGTIEGRLYRGDPRRRAVALTFDDGPVPLYTPLLLDTLSRLGVKATFFLIGQHVREYPYFAQAIVQAGHEVGNHSFHHGNLARLPPERVWEEINWTQETIARVAGEAPRYFRPPGGDYNATVLRVARQFGLVTVFWTDNPGDYLNLDPQVLETRLFLRASNGGIILLHQGIPGTLRVLPVITRILRRYGLEITTVSGLLTP